VKSLSKQFRFSKKGAKDLKKRVNALRSHIEANSVTADDDKFVQILARRASQDIACGITDVVSTTAGIAAGIMLLTPVPIAAEIAGISILTACAIVSLAVWGWKTLIQKGNPFDQRSKCPTISVVDKVWTGIKNTKHNVHSLLTNKKPFLVNA
jgi:hypothetical protein